MSVHRSIYYFSSLNWSLNNSLSNDRLLSDGFGYNRLSNNFSSNNRSAFYRLCLGNHWFRVVGLGKGLVIEGLLTSLSSLGKSFKGSSGLSG